MLRRKADLEEQHEYVVADAADDLLADPGTEQGGRRTTSASSPMTHHKVRYRQVELTAGLVENARVPAFALAEAGTRGGTESSPGRTTVVRTEVLVRVLLVIRTLSKIITSDECRESKQGNVCELQEVKKCLTWLAENRD